MVITCNSNHTIVILTAKLVATMILTFFTLLGKVQHFFWRATKTLAQATPAPERKLPVERKLPGLPSPLPSVSWAKETRSELWSLLIKWVYKTLGHISQ